jgi:hypothetical protein
MPSLYRRLLGPAFDAMPPALRDFHDVQTEWRGTARFRITRGKGWLRNRIADAAGLPQAGEDVPMRLRIVAEGEGERWIREFGTHRLESVQRAWRGLLAESFGTTTLGFKLVVEGDSLRLEPRRVWVLRGVPWPLGLAPHGTGVEVGRDDGCAIVATALVPLLGMVARYEGLVVAERPLP